MFHTKTLLYFNLAFISLAGIESTRKALNDFRIIDLPPTISGKRDLNVTIHQFAGGQQIKAEAIQEPLKTFSSF